MNSPVAISVCDVSKRFRIPHEQISSLRGHFSRIFSPMRYEDFSALDGVSFNVMRGDFFGVIGKNGSGKSTLLKVLSGIYLPDRGSVRVEGGISPFLELGVGFNGELSGRDNIYLNGAVLGLRKKEIDRMLDEIIAFSELERFIDQKLKNYSSGMQVRLGFSIAIHSRKDIFIMDEVLAVGDADFQKKCLEKIEDLKREGKTIILVTHDIGVIRQHCTRALVLREGRVGFYGDTPAACDYYTDHILSHSS